MAIVSILIPAYKNISGVVRILDMIDPALIESGEMEVVISDDSEDAEVYFFLKEKSNYSQYFSILRGPQGGAVQNWNFLLSIASGRYIQFMHHDECPAKGSFFSNIISVARIAIHEQQESVFYHGCRIQYPRFKRLHSFRVVSWLLLKFDPTLLLRFNFLGSPSVLLVPAMPVHRFDERLVYLVDADWYVALRKTYDFRSSRLLVNCYPSSDSITSSLFKDGILENLATEERHTLSSPLRPIKILEFVVARSVWIINGAICRVVGFFS